jgi:hypothetical protein
LLRKSPTRSFFLVSTEITGCWSAKEAPDGLGQRHGQMTTWLGRTCGTDGSQTLDADRVAACFAEDAVVRDEGGDIYGRSAIRVWADEVRRKYHFHAEVIAVEEAAGRTVVTAHLTGDFPGNPVDLTYRHVGLTHVS